LDIRCTSIFLKSISATEKKGFVKNDVEEEEGGVELRVTSHKF
jgi:hypothetical protein